MQYPGGVQMSVPQMGMMGAPMMGAPQMGVPQMGTMGGHQMYPPMPQIGGQPMSFPMMGNQGGMMPTGMAPAANGANGQSNGVANGAGTRAAPAVNGSTNKVGKVKTMSTYAAELECDEKDTRHWIHRWCIDYNNGQLAKTPNILEGTDLAPTIPNCIKVSVQKNGNRNCFGVRPITECIIEGNKQFWKKGPYSWRTYSQVYGDMQNAAKGLLSLPGVGQKRAAKKQVVAAMLAETSAEWMVSAQASLACGITLTTVYATLGHEAMMYGINQTEAEIIFVDWGLYEQLKGTVLAKCPALRHIVFIGKDFVPQRTTGAPHVPFPRPEDIPPIGQAKCTTLDALIATGAGVNVDVDSVAPGGEDLAIIMYTSGSTGLPKGVMLTHINFVSVVASAIAQGTILPKANDVLIDYLPLAHIMEQIVEVVSMTQGACLGFAHPRTLTASSPYIKSTNGVPDVGFEPDLAALRPTVMLAVPAILDLIAGGLKKKMEVGLVGKLFNGAVARRMGREGGCGLCACLDNTILGKVRVKIGLDRIRLLISGGAPLSSETHEWSQAVFAPVAQGYGATETAACATVQECFSSGNRPVDLAGGRVGAIQPATEIKLLSVPDMGYLVTDDPPRGEVLIAGYNVTQHGYYKMPEETKKAFITHSDGKKWFHTGDVGVMDKDGVLRIVDRKKDLVKLQGGEYVSLGKVEANLKQVPGISACCVFARSDKDHCVVIVSQPEKGWASVGGRPSEAALVPAIASKLRQLGLARFEIPTKVGVDDLIWTPETGLVTASMKVQRTPLREHYNKAGGLLEKLDYSFK